MVGPGPLGDAIVLLLCCCFRGVSCRHRQVGFDERDLEEKRGGVDPRAAGLKAFPHQTTNGYLLPPVPVQGVDFR